MKTIHTSILLFAAAIFNCRGGSIRAGGEWNYTDQDAWKNVPGWYCYGVRQSPINIRTYDAVIYRDLTNLTLWNFDQHYSGTFENNGHTVKFTPASGSPAALFQNYLGTYQLQQFHLHWGNDVNQGSEHTVNGESASGELHFVTKKTTGIGTTGDSYAVLAIFLIALDSIPMTGTIKVLYDNMPTADQQSNSITGVQLTDFLPNSLNYYHYEGSLTTPPCSEVVQWFVVRELFYVPTSFVVKLRSIQSSAGGALTENFRFRQPLNGRQVMIRSNCHGDGRKAYKNQL